MAKEEFKKGIERALQNKNLTGALDRFQEAYTISRQNAYAGVDIEGLREKVQASKAYAAENMEKLVAQFKEQAEARGAKVFIAKSGQEAKDYIFNLAREKGVKTIVKSKSMASEEIHLNEYIQQHSDITVKETDLGEWIIQLAGQKPSHMVMPAIHLTKEEVADIFSKEVDERLTTDIPRLVKVARNELRKYFLEAEMGISGANIAVAETGTLVIFTNEGNARLVSTLPKIHVALVGMEKLLANFEEVEYVMQSLPRSATAQQLTSYVTMITGVTPTVVENGYGEKELHIILMDNGRTEMRDDPLFKQALQCVRCASCLNVCPVYRMVGGHVFGHVYAGGIGTILTAFFNEMKDTEDIQGLCIQCGKCKEICPGKIDIPRLILELRKKITKEKGQPFAQKMIFESVLTNRRRFHSLLRMASKTQGLVGAKDGYIRHLPLFFSDLTANRSLPAVAEVPFRDLIKKPQKINNKKGKVVFYGGCLIDFVYPEVGEAVVKVMNSEGYEVLFPEEQTCCGAPAKYSGVEEVAKLLAKQNLDALLEVEADYVISACPTCTGALTHDFLEQCHGDPVYKVKAEKLAAKTRDFSHLIHELKSAKGEFGKVVENGEKITYHDSCHLKRALGIFKEPRELLTGIAGCDVVEMNGSDVCCGMGGSYMVKFPELSKPILELKLKNIAAANTAVVAMDCPGCMLQIGGGLDNSGNFTI
ncbi:MAG: LUD domain-containing protein [Bacillota bacterium]|nr:LUD domain-containing protein [Bacillota bacterium]